MAARPEILTQLARMLGDDSLRSATDAQVRAAVERRFDVLVAAVVAETADSDDVFDRESALRYATLRLEALGAVLSPETASRLKDAVTPRLASW